MAETPEERLARLRREVESTMAPEVPDPPSVPVPPAPRPPEPGSPIGDPQAGPVSPAASNASPTSGATAPPSVIPQAAAPRDEAAPRAAPPSAPYPADAASTGLRSRPADLQPRSETGEPDDGWSLSDVLGGASLGQWVALGLLAVGGYLLLLQIVPGLSLPGSIGMAVGGAVLLWLHLTHRAGSWGLYAGAVLLAVGTLRVIASLLPFNVNGETSLGVGLAFLAIAYLRHTQAGGYGWQGAVAVVALGWGAIQFALGLLPGAPGILDLVLPVLILGAGAVLLLRTLGKRS